jgi:hypothetical protein
VVKGVPGAIFATVRMPIFTTSSSLAGPAPSAPTPGASWNQTAGPELELRQRGYKQKRVQCATLRCPVSSMAAATSSLRPGPALAMASDVIFPIQASYAR